MFVSLYQSCNVSQIISETSQMVTDVQPQKDHSFLAGNNNNNTIEVLVYMYTVLRYTCCINH